MSTPDLAGILESWQRQVDAGLERCLDEAVAEPGCPERLAQTMRYAVLGPGKRLRPLLVLGALRAVGAPAERGLRAACALELLHAYSLVHDDLPAMDDDDYRRGQPSCHRAFGEALAILAGDALLTLAFRVLAGAVPPDLAAEAVDLLAAAAGPAGTVGGQADDVQASSGVPPVEEVEAIHRRKTGRLIEASVQIGGLLGHASEAQLQALGHYGRATGLAFQIADDILSAHGDEKILGRPAESDRQKGRRTYPLAAGLEASRSRAAALLGEAQAVALGLGDGADVLVFLARQVGQRAGVGR